ncbi:rho GTPase-activating protein 11A [Tiliqua scincoides]|uniref:rho GTPase-activating protein 11A n=1 Tax=Tiliqua scincoides TaxID=71010 RepID=UPI0034628DBC
MDSSNLAVIFAPNLLQSSEPDKISVQTDKKLRLQAAVVQTLIDHAEDIGNIPKYILDKMPAMLGIDDPVSTPVPKDCDESEGETPGESKRRRRRSLGDIVSGALNKLKSNRTPSTTPQKDRSVFSSVTPVLVTPSTKRKYPADSVQGFSNKKRRSLRHNLALELLPSSVFNISSTPASAQFEASPCASLEASQSLLSTSITSDKQSIGSRRSKRIASKKVQRVESGKMGCFSPKISRKEMVRRSLRLKFLLGKSNKENAAVEHPATNRTETIGRRLASQTDMENGVASVQTVVLLSPHVGKTITKKGSKNISKSEENLQMANSSNEASYRISWTGCSATESQETYNNGTPLMAKLETCSSEPALTTTKPAIIPAKCRPVDGTTEQNSNREQMSFCEDESNLTTDTLLKIKRAFSESGSNLHNLLETEPSKLNLTRETACISGLSLERQLSAAPAQKMTMVEQKTVLTSSANKAHVIDKHLSNTDQVNSMEGSLFPITTDTNSLILELNESDGLVLESQLPGMPCPGIRISTETLELNRQSTPPKIIENKKLRKCNLGRETKEILETRQFLSKLQKDEDGSSNQYLHMETHEKSSPPGKVADHIHWFNALSLNDQCSAAKTKPPPKFQRTPVRQSVRRMNSLLEANKQSAACKLIKPGDSCLSLEKSLSYETALSCAEGVSSTATTSHDQLAQSSISYPQLPHPLEQAGRPGTTCKVRSITTNQSKSVLEDRTNHDMSKTLVKLNTSLSSSVATPDRCAVRKLLVEKKTRYRGSPKNPIATAKLFPAIKPVDF